MFSDSYLRYNFSTYWIINYRYVFNGYYGLIESLLKAILNLLV